MKKPKPGEFSATKAVKANARERVGQPKPARVVEDTPKTGRQEKHKPKMDELIRAAGINRAIPKRGHSRGLMDMGPEGNRLEL